MTLEHLEAPQVAARLAVSILQRLLGADLQLRSVLDVKCVLEVLIEGATDPLAPVGRVDQTARELVVEEPNATVMPPLAKGFAIWVLEVEKRLAMVLFAEELNFVGVDHRRRSLVAHRDRVLEVDPVLVRLLIQDDISTMGRNVLGLDIGVDLIFFDPIRLLQL